MTSKAAVNSVCRSRHAAAIWKSGSLLSIGINKSRLMNAYVNWTEDCPVPSTHAEESAIRQCENMGIDLRGTTIYVSRVNKKGQELMSAPCVKCRKLIVEAGIKNVVYTT